MNLSERPIGQVLWTRPEMKAIALNAGKMTVEQVTKEVNAVGGNNRLTGGIKKKAAQLGYSLIFRG